MGIIRQLPPEEVQKIAAGEVVERPASIVKELVENSLDAGATTINVFVQEGGKALIRVVDNGCGMDLDDLRASIIPHATSKITHVADLSSLTSFGFRGEALSTIAAVAQVTLKSRHQDADSGYRLQVEAGAVIAESEVGMSVGTDIEVKNLFFNVPARLKFLKTVETEWRQIMQLMQSFALAHLGVHFCLYHHSQLVYNWPSVDDLASRALQVFDEYTSRALIEISGKNDYAEVSGAVSNHQFMRYARTHIFLFVNNRWIRNNGISKALLKAYADVLQAGKFPAAFLFIKVDPSVVDVNTHPRKEEVLLEHSTKIEQLVFQSVQQVLGSQVTAHKAVPSEFFKPAQLPPERPSAVGFHTTVTPSRLSAPASSSFDFEPLPVSTQLIELQSAAPLAQEHMPVHEPYEAQQHVAQEMFAIIGQLKKTYILVERTDGLWMVDQHAAHERILYEKFKSRFEEVASTRLMFPARVALEQYEIEILRPYLPLLQQEGLEVEPFGEGQLVVYSAPSYAKNIDFNELLAECINNIQEIAHFQPEDIFRSLRERVHAMMACKAAIKAGDVLDMQQMHELIQTLEKTANKLTCPHGRPTTWILTTYELERKFKRLV